MKIEANFVEYKKNNFKDYVLIEGFPGMGLVGTIAAKYLVEKKKFEEVGYIDSNLFSPIIRVQDSMPVRPARIYADKKKKIAVLISEQVLPKEGTYVMAKKTADWIKEKGIVELISLSGVNAHGDTPKSHIIYGIAANELSKPLLKKYGLNEISEGVTTGITALILLELRKYNIKAISILANVNLSADYKAAAEVLKKLNEILGLELDVQPLIDEAREVEKQFLEQLQRLQQTKDNAEKFENKAPVIT
jgi:uncharacterized protein